MAASIAGETFTIGRSGRGGPMNRRMRVACGLGPLKGGSPASIS